MAQESDLIRHVSKIVQLVNLGWVRIRLRTHGNGKNSGESEMAIRKNLIGQSFRRNLGSKVKTFWTLGRVSFNVQRPRCAAAAKINVALPKKETISL